jgi:hypothetical protein
MKRILFTLAALAVTAVLSTDSSVDAKPAPKKPAPPKVTPSKGSFKITIDFRLRSYRGWNSYCYMPSYGCYCFYDPASETWFYWYEPTGQFLPIGSLPTSVPTTSGAAMLPPGAIPVNTTTAGTSTPAPPAPPPPPAPPAPPAPVVPVDPAPDPVDPPAPPTPMAPPAE